MIRPAQPDAPADGLLARAIRAVDTLGRRTAESSQSVRFDLLGCSWAVAEATEAADGRDENPHCAAIEKIEAALDDRAARDATGKIRVDRLYLAVSQSPAELQADDGSADLARWQQSVLRHCRPGALHQFIAPQHADLDALWHAADERSGVHTALVVARAPLPVGGASAAHLCTALLLAAAGSSAMAPAASLHRSAAAARVRDGGSAAGLPETSIALALMASMLAAHDLAHAANLQTLLRTLPQRCRAEDGERLEWQSSQPTLRCVLRPRDTSRTAAPSSPMAAALALLQQISGYPLQQALDGANASTILAIDSLAAMEFSERIHAAFGLRFPVDALLDRPSVYEFVQRLHTCFDTAASDDAFLPRGRLRSAEGAF